jgi:hypothetical protein
MRRFILAALRRCRGHLVQYDARGQRLRKQSRVFEQIDHSRIDCGQ